MSLLAESSTSRRTAAVLEPRHTYYVWAVFKPSSICSALSAAFRLYWFWLAGWLQGKFQSLTACMMRRWSGWNKNISVGSASWLQVLSRFCLSRFCAVS